MKINTKSLSAALSALSKITSTRMSLPILSCVKIETKGKTLRLSASNLDEYQTEIVECEGKLPDMCVSLGKFQHSVGMGETTTLEKDGEFLIIQPSGVGLGILSADEFPAGIDIKKMEGIGVSCADLADAIDRVEFAKSKSADRFALQPVHIVGEPKKIYAEASDGRSLAWFDRALICCDFDILVMGTFCASFCEKLRRDGSSLMRDENNLLVSHANGTYSCKIPEVQYPNTKSISVPSEKDLLGSVNIEEMKGVLATGLAISDGRFYLSAKFNFTGAGLWISFNDPKQAAKMDGFVSGEFKSGNVALDMQFVKNALSALEAAGEKCAKFYMTDELSAVKFTAGDLSVAISPIRMS